MSAGQRETLSSIARSAVGQHRRVQRARALLLAADGVANSVIAARLNVTRTTVLTWRERFEAEGLRRFGDVREGRGRRPLISDAKVAEVVGLTQTATPAGATHWS